MAQNLRIPNRQLDPLVLSRRFSETREGCAAFTAGRQNMCVESRMNFYGECQKLEHLESKCRRLIRRAVLFAGATVGVASIGLTAHASLIANFHENLNAGNSTLFLFGAENTTGSITGNDGLIKASSLTRPGYSNLALEIAVVK